ncbi:MAG: hypothetical protein ABIQ75_03200 [Flavobacteriales bacterium]
MNVKTTLKALCLLTATASIPMVTNAQFEKGDNVLGVGIGVLGGYNVGLSGSGVTQSPAFSLHFDHAMGELGPGTWGLGGYVGFKTTSYKYDYIYYNYDRRYTFLVFGARGTWHYNSWHTDKLDTYAGVLLAFKSVSVKDNTDYGAYPNNYSYSGSGFGPGAFIGARYYFSDNIGAYAELGYGITVIQLGLTVKF